MKTLVTGAAGFVGAAVVKELLAQGREVRAMVRKGSNDINLKGLDVERFDGDLLNEGSLRESVKGCQRVFHVAALYTFWTPDPQLFYETNVEGTERLMRICEEKGVERIVYTSTTGTIGFHPDGSLGDENTVWNLGIFNDHYVTSKRLAEVTVQKWAARGLPVVIVNPAAPIGPGDAKPTPTGQMVIDFIKGRIPVYTETGLNFVHVTDVARGHLLAEEKGRLGERYILGDWNGTLKEVFDILAKVTGKPAPRFKVGPGVALLAGHAVEFIMGSLLGKMPMLTAAQGRMAAVKVYVDNGKAKRELGWETAPIEQAFQESVEWYRKNGYL